MAQAKKFICRKCGHIIETRPEGNPFYIDDAGQKRYAYHPDHDGLARCIGNDVDCLCRACGLKCQVDSRFLTGQCRSCGEATSPIDRDGHRFIYGTVEKSLDGSLVLTDRRGGIDERGEFAWWLDFDRRCLGFELGREPTTDELLSYVATRNADAGRWLLRRGCQSVFSSTSNICRPILQARRQPVSLVK